MIDAIVANKEFSTLAIAGIAVLVSLFFGGFRGWRHKICFEYESRRDVAITVINDSFVQRTSKHYKDIDTERRKNKTEVEAIYRRPEHQQLIRNLAADLDDANTVRRAYNWLNRLSALANDSLWYALVACIVAIALVMYLPLQWLMTLLTFIIVTLTLLFISCVSLMCYWDRRFFNLVHRIIEPEGESP